MRKLTATGSLIVSHVTSTETPPRAGLVAAWDTITNDNSMPDIENPTSYEAQVEKCREIWPVHSGSGKFPDPVVGSIMDMLIAAIVAYGSEIMMKDIPADHPAKQIVDDYIARVNSGTPTLTPGMDYVREQAHKRRYVDGGCVPAWGQNMPWETSGGISYEAPANIAIYPRTQFDLDANGPFGSWKLVLKDDLNDTKENLTDEKSENAEPVALDDFLAAGRYWVFDRGRLESSQKYPVPFLSQRGLTGICARIRTNQRGDYDMMLRSLRSILLLKRGSDAWIEEAGLEAMLNQSNFTPLKTGLTTTSAASGFMRILSSDYSTTAEYIQPDMQAMLSAEKFKHDDMERLAALGVLEIIGSGQRLNFSLNPRPLMLELKSALLADRRFMEGVILPLLWKANPGIFKGISPANFHHKPLTGFLEQFEKELLKDLWERGVISSRTWVENALGSGADLEAEVHQREFERDSGYDKTLEIRPTFSQTVVKKGKSETTEQTDAGLNASLVDVYDQTRIKARESKDDFAVKMLVVGMTTGIAADLASRLRDSYADQFDGPTLDVDAFETYIAATTDRLNKFGRDLLNGGATGTTGLLFVLGDAFAVDAVFASNLHRIALYEVEPFKQTVIAAQAAKARVGGNTHAVVHAAFAPTTCDECIAGNGRVITIDEAFSGEWDHPHGFCTLTFHKDLEAAQIESSEMLTVVEIDRIFEVLNGTS